MLPGAARQVFGCRRVRPRAEHHRGARHHLGEHPLRRADAGHLRQLHAQLQHHAGQRPVGGAREQAARMFPPGRDAERQPRALRDLVHALQHQQVRRPVRVPRVDPVRGRHVQHHPRLRPGQHADVDDGPGQTGRAGHRPGEAGVVDEASGRHLGQRFSSQVRLPGPGAVRPVLRLRAEPPDRLERQVFRGVLRIGLHAGPE